VQRAVGRVWQAPGESAYQVPLCRMGPRAVLGGTPQDSRMACACHVQPVDAELQLVLPPRCAVGSAWRRRVGTVGPAQPRHQEPHVLQVPTQVQVCVSLALQDGMGQWLASPAPCVVAAACRRRVGTALCPTPKQLGRFAQRVRTPQSRTPAPVSPVQRGCTVLALG
jgi:hypothetical protein